MAKPTLLQMVQDILFTLDSDEVGSISDTYEATQVARQLRSTYKEIVVEYNLGSHEELSTLTPLSDPNFPTHFKIPDNMYELKWWKYNKKESLSDPDIYSEVHYMDPKEFVEYVNARDSTASNVQVVLYGPDQVKLNIQNDAHPKYWTSFDDEYIVADSFFSTLDTTLQESKVQALMTTMPAFTLSDTFVAELPENLFPLLQKTAEAKCYSIYKQTENLRLDREERWQRIRAQRLRYNVTQRNRFLGPNFGR